MEGEKGRDRKGEEGERSTVREEEEEVERGGSLCKFFRFVVYLD